MTNAIDNTAATATATPASLATKPAKLLGFLPNPLDLFDRPKPGKVHIIQLHGAIMPGNGGPTSGPVLNIEALDEGISAAFKPALDKPGALDAVALSINCPGGSPVQSSLIAGRIRDLADRAQVPVIAYVQDVAASGGYWLACSADDIVVDASSIVGSIGVISAGFGFTGAMEKLGVERRLHTAGANKSRLDSFSAEKPDDVDWLLALQSKLHGQFRAFVKSRRDHKLGDYDEDALMNGEVWLGDEAAALGLADQVGHMHSDLRARFGDKVKIKKFGQKKKGLLSNLPFLSSFDLADGVARSLEARSMWSRFGL